MNFSVQLVQILQSLWKAMICAAKAAWKNQSKLSVQTWLHDGSVAAELSTVTQLCLTYAQLPPHFYFMVYLSSLAWLPCISLVKSSLRNTCSIICNLVDDKPAMRSALWPVWELDLELLSHYSAFKNSYYTDKMFIVTTITKTVFLSVLM